MRAAEPQVGVRRYVDVPTIVITGFYTAAWFLILFNGGRYWDDWCAVALSPQAAQLWAHQLGQVWQPLYWLALSWVPGIEYVVHGLTFILFLVSALLLNRILRLVPGLDEVGQTLIPVLFAVFPVNAARLALVDFQYTLSIAAFYGAWYLIARDLVSPGVWRRVAAGLLLGFALITTNSLLAFAFLIPLFILWVRADVLRDGEVRGELLRRYGFLVVLPFAAFILRAIALKPSGLYAGYNSLGAGGALRGVLLLPAAVRASLLEPIVSALPWLLAAVPVYFLVRQFRDRLERTFRLDLMLLGAGILTFVLGTYPYLAVGKLPQSAGGEWWDSRHQVLVPLGAALVIYAAFMLLGRLARARHSIVIALLAALALGFVVADFRTAVAYQADWYKQLALTRHLAQDDAVRDANAFYFRDNTLAFNVLGRRYQPYELMGMMHSVFGDATRFAADESMYANWIPLMSALRGYEQYHFGGFVLPAEQYDLELTPGDIDITRPGTTLGLLRLQLTNSDAFDDRISRIVRLRSTPLPPTGQ